MSVLRTVLYVTVSRLCLCYRQFCMLLYTCCICVTDSSVCYCKHAVSVLQTVLYGTERSGGEAAAGLPARHLHSDDRHRTVDLPLRRPQNAQGVFGYRLHAPYAGRSRLSAQQQQILPQQVREGARQSARPRTRRTAPGGVNGW